MDKTHFKKLIIREFTIFKNCIQYSIGVMLFYLTFGVVYPIKLLFGLVGFVMAYHSVYQFNDLIDYKDDKKNEIKKYYKPLASGETTREKIESYSFLFMLLGLSISFLVSMYFGLLVAFTLFLNFLHTSPFTRLKKTRLLLPNLFIIEFVKFSLGWLAMSFSISNFPFIFIALLSSSYLLGYLYSTKEFYDFFNDIKIKFFIIASSILYVVSFLIYPFKLILLMPIPIVIVFFILKKFENAFMKVKIRTGLIYVLGIYFIISMMLLTVPVVANINDKIDNGVNAIKDNIIKSIPENLKFDIETVNKVITSMNRIKEVLGLV